MLFSLLFLSVSVHASTSELAQVTTTDGQKLKAAFMLPSTQTKAVILILQGSGNVDLDGDVSGPFLGMPYHNQSGKLSLQLAESLANLGIATLRFSKRGFDDATQLPNQKFPFLVNDAESAYQLMLARFPTIKHGVIGFSEGGLVASFLASDMPVDALYLLAPVTRPIDQVFGYQFIEWPTKLMLNHLTAAQDESISATTISKYSDLKLPLIGAPLSSLDADKDGQISISGELFPAYQNYYFAVRGLLATPALSGWYESLKALGPYAETAAKIKSPSIYIYQGMDDAQLNWIWTLEDSYSYPVKPVMHFYPHVGHCFSPMDGMIGEVKTSGPYAPEMLKQLGLDALQSLK